MYCVGRQGGKVDNTRVDTMTNLQLDVHAHVHMCMRTWYGGVWCSMVQYGAVCVVLARTYKSTEKWPRYLVAVGTV